jgi:hypothetical protein
VEVTEKMLDAAVRADWSISEPLAQALPKIFQAMLAAAPKPEPAKVNAKMVNAAKDAYYKAGNQGDLANIYVILKAGLAAAPKREFVLQDDDELVDLFTYWVQNELDKYAFMEAASRDFLKAVSAHLNSQP